MKGVSLCWFITPDVKSSSSVYIQQLALWPVNSVLMKALLPTAFLPMCL